MSVKINHVGITLCIERLLLFLFMIGVLACTERTTGNKLVKQRPNILLIVADDLGYADIGCYGGDIETPNLNNLATQGIRFSQFHTAPLCAPTRAMLLSGNDNHIAGMGNMFISNEEFGYEGRLTNRIVPIPALLKQAGYHTYMAGKWHLGSAPESNPHQKGFEHSFALLEGWGNHYIGRSNANYSEDGNPTTWEDGNYSTDFYTDKIIAYIDSNIDDDKPFFAFASYTSPHWPLQVDKKYWEKYKGLYDDGYEKLKESRLESLKKVGMIPQDAKLPPYHESVKPWDSLSKEEKMKEVKKMELYAGMVDNLDYNIGRLIKYLKKIEKYDNTLIVFISDNGAAPLNSNNSNYDYENMGESDTFVAYGPQWAEAGSSPFRYYKYFATQGGINTPMIISGPKIEKDNEIHHGFTTVMDLAPTFYEAAQISYPKTFENHEVYPLRGNSLFPFLSGKTTEIHTSDYVFGIEHDGNAMIRKGNWKITNITPFIEENFKLYNLSNDLAELNDLKESEPKKYAEMLREWSKFSNEIKVIQSIEGKLKYIIDNEGIDIGVKKYWQLKKNEAHQFNFREIHLNNLGYSYLDKGEIQKAIAVFKLNVEAYPNSANVYYSYGEALLKANRKTETIKMYEKSIELNPDNEYVKNKLNKIKLDN